jgi:SOS-response transcriptional repressor LexA
MMTLGERIKVARLKAAVTKSELAAAAGVSPSAVTQWENGDTKTLKSASLLSAARILRVNYEWLATGKGRREVSDLEPGPDIKGKVPLISWVQAGDWAAAVDNFHPGMADEWVETTVPIRQHTYALRVRGDSMTNPTGEEPTFPDGTKIVIEPDAIDTPDKLVGSLVIVKRGVDDEATFKQLVKDAGRFYLKPINPRYPMLELRDGDVICGVVREKVVRYF